MQWYYLVQGQRQGPVEEIALESLVRQGVVRDDTYVWREGMAEWQLYSAVKPKPAPSARSIAPAAPASAGPSVPGPSTAAPGVSGPSTGPAERPAESPLLSGGYAAATPPGSQSTTSRPVYSPPVAASRPAAQAPKGKKSPGAFFFYPVLDALSDGSVIRRCVIIGLKVASIISLLGGLLMALTILAASARGSGGALLGGILAALIILGTSLCAAQILWYRSGSVASLTESRYTVIPIFSILSRAFGETGAAGLTGLGVGACLLLWLTPSSDVVPLAGIPFVSGLAYQSGFLAGLILLVYMVGSGFLALIVGYLWAECIILLVDIEKNTRGGT